MKAPCRRFAPRSPLVVARRPAGQLRRDSRPSYRHCHQVFMHMYYRHRRATTFATARDTAPFQVSAAISGDFALRKQR